MANGSGLLTLDRGVEAAAAGAADCGGYWCVTDSAPFPPPRLPPAANSRRAMDTRLSGGGSVFFADMTMRTGARRAAEGVRQETAVSSTVNGATPRLLTWRASLCSERAGVNVRS
ncbi:hypothetical protein GJAV_G00155030 [Gymnothorax javanicus]|nr:hypothetical protein GJAV_G00155030 [Gymnothorax javanicus]